MMNVPELVEARLFEAALECCTPAERAAYLDQACAGQPELRQRVEALLKGHEQSGQFMEAVAAERPTVALDLAPQETPATVIGRYKLLQKIGEGGMGVVYMAEQTEPVVRKVALKIIKLGMDTKQVVARFEAERQALALMDHPNIAKVLDAGATDCGRPYFVMELVHGVPMTEFCDKNKLTTQERLELFIPVCQAIQHAHQKGIIHRDIKPSNVMVTLHDSVPVPKVIDFGVAKATNQRLTEKTLFTNYGQIIGTPAYMSPEQAEMSGLDIDTRSDIYSLGVLLYELLTGTTPFDAKELLCKGYAEMQRIIVENEPVKPSTRMSTLTDDQRTVVTSHRSTDASALRKILQGDLDSIVMKCLEKDRTRRYETSNGLAADLRRHLNNELITARPPTTGYLLKKLIKRNKVVFATASLVAAALMIGFGVATWQYYRERVALQRAVAAERKQSELRNSAEESQGRAELRAYASDLAFASSAASLDGSLGSVDALLSRWRNHTPDLRGWEWYYLNGNCHRERLLIQASTNLLRWVAWSPDGQRLATAGLDPVVRIWSASNGHELASLAGHTEEVLGLAWSPGGKRLASASCDKTVRVWDPESSRTVLTCEGHTDWVYCVAWNPDGKTIASSGRDQTIKIWDANAGTLLQTFPAKYNVSGLAWSPDGRLLASCGDGDVANVWDTTKGGVPVSLSIGGVSWTAAIDWSPDGTRLVLVSNDGGVRVLNAKSGAHIFSKYDHDNIPHAVAWSPNGSNIVSGCRGNGEIRIRDALTGDPFQIFRGHLGAVRFISWSPTGTELASAGSDGTVRIWPVRQENRLSKLIKKPGQALSLAWNVDGRHLAHSTIEGSVWVWDTAHMSAEPFHIQAHNAWAAKIAWNPAGTRLASGNYEGDVKVWDWPAGTLAWSVRAHPAECRGLAWSPDGTKLASSSGRDRRLKIWDAATGASSAQFDMNIFGTLTLAWSPDGKRLASGRNDILVLDVATGRLIWKLCGHAELLRQLAWSPDGRRLASASDDSTVKVWDMDTGKELQNLVGHRSQVYSVAWSPDGSRLASAGWAGDIKIWNPTSARLVFSLDGGKAAAFSIDWNPDGRCLAYSTVNGEVVILDATPGYELERERRRTP